MGTGKTLNISRFMPFVRCMAVLTIVCWYYPAAAQQAAGTAAVDNPITESESQAAEIKVLISELAASSDLVAIARVAYTNYEYRRGFAVDGYADLQILIPYKTETVVDRVRVRESGLHSGECYFPPTFPSQEGARFLVFLSRHPDGDYRGNPVTCKLGVLVTDRHGYAIRYPLDGKARLTVEQQDWIEDINFNDPNAFAGSAEMTPGRKAALAEQIDGIVTEQGVKYTKGLPVTRFSQLIGQENILRPSREGRY